MSIHHSIVAQLHSSLGNLEHWLDAGVAFAEKKKFDPKVLLHARLAPDQYPLYRQVQAACDQAKFIAARLSGKDAPKHPDDEQSLEELRARIHDVRTYLAGFTDADFAGADERIIPLPFAPGKGMLGRAYLVQMALPNFYFHLTTAYAILRKNGLDLGKRDFIGALDLRDL